jgi:hypothetical protein
MKPSKKKASREELERSLSESRRALPFGVAGGLIMGGAVWAAHHWLRLSWGVLPTAFALPVAYTTNIVYCRWALRRLSR